MHSGNNGSSGSLPSSGGGGVSSINSDDINNGEHLLNNNNTLESGGGVAEVCDVPDEVANQKRHVSSMICWFERNDSCGCDGPYRFASSNPTTTAWESQ